MGWIALFMWGNVGQILVKKGCPQNWVKTSSNHESITMILRKPAYDVRVEIEVLTKLFKEETSML